MPKFCNVVNGMIFVYVGTGQVIAPLHGITVLIDPGHGGVDPGAIGSLNGVRFNESDLAMDISLYLRLGLLGLGATVNMTHGGNSTYSPVPARDRNMTYGNPDLVISMHLNSSTNLDAFGTLIYYTSECATSRSLGSYVQDSLIELFGATRWNRVSPSSGWAVVANAEAPAILVEAGFMSHTAELEFIVENIREIADAILDGIVNHINSQQ